MAVVYDVYIILMGNSMDTRLVYVSSLETRIGARWITVNGYCEPSRSRVGVHICKTKPIGIGGVEQSAAVYSIRQNKANYRGFWPENGDRAEEQSQSKPIYRFRPAAYAGRSGGVWDRERACQGAGPLVCCSLRFEE